MRPRAPTPAGAPAHPAATVVLLRTTPDGCEVLLVQRNARLDFHGGAWVFPGGRIDPEDYRAAESDAPEDAARWAAVREAREEAGIGLAPETLVCFARWVTPEGLPKRFDTWFFAAPGGGHDVAVDGGEIERHRWLSPAAALEAHDRGEVVLPPPTYVTLARLAPFRSAEEGLAALAAGPREHFVPRLRPVAGGAVSLYAGDAAYEGGDLDAPGPRHRLWMLEGGWRYERRPG